MKVFLAAAVPWKRDRTPLPAFEKIAYQDRFQEHTLTNDVADADIILFVDAHLHARDWRVQSIRNHPLALRYPKKVCLYDERDRPWCSLPGVYVSMPRQTFDPKIQRAYAYYTNNMTERLQLSGQIRPDLLFSFMGARSHKMRKRLFSLAHPRAEITDTSQINFFVPSGEPDYADKIERQKQAFVTTLLRSKFVICPRGAGTSSIRLYETMASGRVPVIVSDDWQRPIGPDWDSLAITIPEAEIENIPQILETREPEYETMKLSAQAAYADWFAPDVMFHHLIENCLQVMQNPRRSRLLPDRQYLKCGMDDAYLRGKMHLVRLRDQMRRGSTKI